MGKRPPEQTQITTATSMSDETSFTKSAAPDQLTLTELYWQAKDEILHEIRSFVGESAFDLMRNVKREVKPAPESGKSGRRMAKKGETTNQGRTPKPEFHYFDLVEQQILPQLREELFGEELSSEPWTQHEFIDSACKRVRQLTLEVLRAEVQTCFHPKTRDEFIAVLYRKGDPEAIEVVEGIRRL
jgi:hypothetical protein